MRWDHSVRAAKSALDKTFLGKPVLANIDMRAIPHWMPWQRRLGWLTLRIMSIHHLDTFRYWFGDPVRIFASVRTDPRTRFAHDDGICLYILEYASGLRCMGCDDVWSGPSKEGAASATGIGWRIEGTHGLALGTIGWPKYPKRAPSTLRFSTVKDSKCRWHKPKWKEAWFPDAFSGPMAELLCALEEKREPTISGRDNLKTMALVEAAYLSARTHRTVELKEILR
jgi:predicted dehydrogenase